MYDRVSLYDVHFQFFHNCAAIRGLRDLSKGHRENETLGFNAKFVSVKSLYTDH